MSLDVLLISNNKIKRICLHCNSEYESSGEELYSDNITHNLNRMAMEAGIYKFLWRPSTCGITMARQLIEPLGQGLVALKADPKHFMSFDSPNGWGKYENFVSFVENYLNACMEFPESIVKADC